MDSHYAPAVPPTDQDWTDRPLWAASRAHLWQCHTRGLSTNSVHLYGVYESAFLEWCQTQGLGLELAVLNARNVQLCGEWVHTRGKGKRDGVWARRVFIRVMKLWMRWQVDEGRVETDYLARLREPKAIVIARRPLELWEQQALREALDQGPTGVRDVAAFALLLSTGIRIGELVGLTLPNLDMTAYRVTVLGKGGRQRVIPFASAAPGGGTTVRLLREYLAARRPHRLATPTQRQQVFLSFNGWPLSVDAFRDAYQGAAARAGVAPREVHRTRHTYALHYLLQHPGDVDGLRYLLGHLSDDTYRTYTGAAGQILAGRHRHSVVDDWDQPPEDQRAAPPVLSAVPLSRPAQLLETAEAPGAAELVAAVRANPALARALLQALGGVA